MKLFILETWVIKNRTSFWLVLAALRLHGIVAAWCWQFADDVGPVCTWRCRHRRLAATTPKSTGSAALTTSTENEPWRRHRAAGGRLCAAESWLAPGHLDWQRRRHRRPRLGVFFWTPWRRRWRMLMVVGRRRWLLSLRERSAQWRLLAYGTGAHSPPHKWDMILKMEATTGGRYNQTAARLRLQSFP